MLVYIDAVEAAEAEEAKEARVQRAMGTKEVLVARAALLSSRAF